MIYTRKNTNILQKLKKGKVLRHCDDQKAFIKSLSDMSHVYNNIEE